MASSDDCGHIRFFSFSLIEGYISLVMDVQTQQRWAGPCLDITGGGAWAGARTLFPVSSPHFLHWSGSCGHRVIPHAQQDGAEVEIGTIVPKPSVPSVLPQH